MGAKGLGLAVSGGGGRGDGKNNSLRGEDWSKKGAGS